MTIEPREKIQSIRRRRGFCTVHLNKTIFPKLKTLLLSGEGLSSPLPSRSTQILHKKRTQPQCFMGDLVRKQRCHCISSKLQCHGVFTCESPAIQTDRTKGISGLSKSYALMPHLSQQEYPYTLQGSCQLHTDEVCSILECLEVL